MTNNINYTIRGFVELIVLFTKDCIDCLKLNISEILDYVNIIETMKVKNKLKESLKALYIRKVIHLKQIIYNKVFVLYHYVTRTCLYRLLYNSLLNLNNALYNISANLNKINNNKLRYIKYD